MSYATLADANELYGTARISSICDRDDDGSVDTAAFERQLVIASQQIDGYLLGRYPLPLVANGYVVPEIFKKYCVDLAMYNSALDPDVRSKEMRQRFEDALEYFGMIAKNQIKIPLALIPAPEVPVSVLNKSQEASTVGGRAILATEPYRVYTPDNTRRLLG